MPDNRKASLIILDHARTGDGTLRRTVNNDDQIFQVTAL